MSVFADEFHSLYWKNMFYAYILLGYFRPDFHHRIFYYGTISYKILQRRIKASMAYTTSHYRRGYFKGCNYLLWFGNRSNNAWG